MLLWLSLLFKRRRSSPHNVESAGRLTCAFYNLQLFPFFTQATLSHAEMRPARFVVDPRLLASHLPGLAIQGSAATNASCPRYASRNAYLPYIMHGCDRFDLSPRSNTQSTYCKFQVNRAGRRQIESVALCACRRHLRIISTL